MNPEEYDRLAEVERKHWFYRGKREIVRHWISKLGNIAKDSLLVDAGAGTGFFAYEMSAQCRVLAIDDHEEALGIARKRLGPEQVRSGPCHALPVADGTAAIVTALDVLEHLEADRPAVAEFARILQPGGLLVITVPAMPVLWSDWDVALHHYRRYNKTSLRAALERDDLELLHLEFANVLVMPLIWLVRKWRAWFGSTDHRLEDSIPPEPLNTFLRWSYVGLACQTWVSFPFGVSLVAVARRR